MVQINVQNQNILNLVKHSPGLVDFVIICISDLKLKYKFEPRSVIFREINVPNIKIMPAAQQGNIISVNGLFFPRIWNHDKVRTRLILKFAICHEFRHMQIDYKRIPRPASYEALEAECDAFGLNETKITWDQLKEMSISIYEEVYES